MKALDAYNVLREVWPQGDKLRVDHLYSHIIRLRNASHTDEQKAAVYKRLYAFNSQIKQRWQASRRVAETFLSKNSDFLERDVDFLHFMDEESQATGEPKPRKSFEDVSDRTKRRRVTELCEKASSSELLNASASKLYVSGDRQGASAVRRIISNDFVKDVVNCEATGAKQNSPEEALSLIVEAKLTKSQYLLLRSNSAGKGKANLYPAYEHIKSAKRKCYPDPSSVHAGESGGSIDLQALMDHTVMRLIQSLSPVVNTLNADQLNNIVLFNKWGSDASSGYSIHKQSVENETLDDRTLFVTSVVPLQLVCIATSGEKEIIWNNPRPSSARYCRPLRFTFEKETTEAIRLNKNNIETEIENLRPSTCEESGQTIVVSHKFFMTMVDGKVCNAVTGTASTQTCYICKAKPSHMQDIEAVIKRTPDENTYQFGLSTLHGWIRCFEYLLHISYKVEVKTFQCRLAKDKEAVEQRKKAIQKAFMTQLRIPVDMPKQGFGSSNDGNTARAFFADPQVTAGITGVDKDLIERFSVILRALASAFEINTEEFRLYTLDTAKMCVRLYPWYIMPPSVHKILIHGHDIIKSVPLPIGMLSEDAQESKHKDCKYFRVFNTRKSSRIACNEDLLHMCLISSDPFITSMRKLPLRQSTPFPAAVLRLLKEPSL